MLESVRTQLKFITPTFPPAGKLQKGLQEPVDTASPYQQRRDCPGSTASLFLVTGLGRYFRSDKTRKQKCTEEGFGRCKCVNSDSKKN